MRNTLQKIISLCVPVVLFPSEFPPLKLNKELLKALSLCCLEVGAADHHVTYSFDESAFSLRMSKMTFCLHLSSQNTKQKVVAMETQYKLAARSAQLLAKDAPQDEGARVMATMATAKSQLSKVT